jgi:hypothetical protein
MPVKKAATSKKKSVKETKKDSFFQKLKNVKNRTTARIQDFLARRPHRSFRMTRRRDYVRPLAMPGYFSFTLSVLKLLWTWKRLFVGVVVIYGLLTALLVGLASQETYAQLSETITETGGDFMFGGAGEIAKAGVLLASSVVGGLGTTQFGASVEAQQVVVTILVLLVTWLCTVWLLRAILAGQKPKLRDGLYNSGAPIVPTFFVSLVIVLQLLPVSIAVIGMSVASVSGLFDAGVISMIFWFFIILLGMLSLYWITSTFIALVIVTLPGMYPMRALRTAGDLVVGRRIRILLRILWSLIFSAGIWIIIMIPIILIDSWIKKVIPALVDWPVVPVSLLVMGSLTIVWLASYIYLLYRKVVDDDSAPA